MNAASYFTSKSSLETGNFFYAIYSSIGYWNKSKSVIASRIAAK